MSSPLVSWICFVFCLGLTAGGVLVLFRRKEYGQHLPMRYLRYYLILIYTFGFYALWSRLLLRELYFPIIPPGSRVLLARFLTLISVPFLLAGKAMLVMWAIHVLRPARRQLIASGLIVVSGAVLLGLWGRELLWTVNQIYAAFVLVLMLAMGTLLILGESKYLDRKPQLLLAGLVVGIGAIHLPMLAGTTPASPFEVIFIFLYFLSHTSFATVF
uniref:hypothetical protein n=1 Tax=Persicitalea sp. TaxID=3100273 RepID=UPI0035945643